MWRSRGAWGHLLLRHARHSVHIVESHVICIKAVLTLLLSQCQKLFKLTVGRGEIKGNWSSVLVGMPALFRS